MGDYLTDKELKFTMDCVKEFAKRKDLTLKQTFKYLRKHKAIDFLVEHLEEEYIISFEKIVKDLTMVCRENGGDIL